MNIMSCLFHKKKCMYKCYFCSENHTCRECPLEAEMAPILKKKVGTLMEHYIANNFLCPECNKNTLNVIGNNSPSLDIVCKECSKKIEVKSKCLSVNHLPNDIRLHHGSYYDFMNRLDNGLDLFVVIYGVDRIKKILKIREVLYIPTISLKNSNTIEILKRNDNNLSTILIKDRISLKQMNIPNKDKTIDFGDEIINYLRNKN